MILAVALAVITTGTMLCRVNYDAAYMFWKQTILRLQLSVCVYKTTLKCKILSSYILALTAAKSLYQHNVFCSWNERHCGVPSFLFESWVVRILFLIVKLA